jgi:hypothetical protein
MQIERLAVHNDAWVPRTELALESLFSTIAAVQMPHGLRGVVVGKLRA